MTGNAVTYHSPSSTTYKRQWPSESSNERKPGDHKRQQAAERQRRKRERDRLGISVKQQQEMKARTITDTSSSTSASIVNHSETAQQDTESQPPQQQPGLSFLAAQPSPSTPGILQHQSSTIPNSYMSAQPQGPMSPEEVARRDRVRASARERQRKHRAMVKMRKMENVNGGGNAYPPPGMVLPPPPQEHMSNLMQVFHQQQQQQFSPIPPPGPEQFPPQQPQVRGGQTFATTLLLSFSCAPLLKQHLLRTLNMTDEELASLEPVIADAWEQWDAQRRMYQELGQQQQPSAEGASAPRFRVVPQSSDSGTGATEASGQSTLDPSLSADNEESSADVPPP